MTRIARLSELLRTTLDTFTVDEIPLAGEMDFVRKYMEIEQARSWERLLYEEKLDPAVLGALVPPLILQPLVENAVRHGLAETSGDCTIVVTAAPIDRNLGIEICDTGPGLHLDERSGEAKGVGLTNTKARLERLYGSEHRLELENGRQRGTVVRRVIPLNLDNPSASATNGGRNREENSHVDR